MEYLFDTDICIFLINPLDTLIAAHARSLGVVLVTNNTREFSRVDHLKVENWIE